MSLMTRRNLMATKSGRLPGGYVELDSLIAQTGNVATDCVLTDYVISEDDVIDMYLAITEATTQDRYMINTSGTYITRNKTVFYVRFLSASSVSPYWAGDYLPHKFTLRKGEFLIDDSVKGNPPFNSTSPGAVRFCCGCPAIWTACRVTRAGTLIHDYVPASKSDDGTVGFFDLVDGAYWPAEGLISGGTPI